jgi:hypothetical protein
MHLEGTPYPWIFLKRGGILCLFLKNEKEIMPSYVGFTLETTKRTNYLILCH